MKNRVPVQRKTQTRNQDNHTKQSKNGEQRSTNENDDNDKKQYPTALVSPNDPFRSQNGARGLQKEGLLDKKRVRKRRRKNGKVALSCRRFGHFAHRKGDQILHNETKTKKRPLRFAEVTRIRAPEKTSKKQHHARTAGVFSTPMVFYAHSLF